MQQIQRTKEQWDAIAEEKKSGGNTAAVNMFKVIQMVFLTITLSVSQVLLAQTKTVSPTTPTPIASNYGESQWEYLVVSYGKTLFGSPEKTLAYRSIGLAATAQEANEIQQSLDILGRFGWEIVTVVGAIGGDQQIVMKRRYEKTRVANEGLGILKGRELYLKDLIDILERGKKVREESETAAVAARNQPKLVDLDAKEAEERRIKLTSDLEAKVKLILSSIKGVNEPNVSVRVLDSEGKYNYVEIKTDSTAVLLKNGNTYRATEAKNWLLSILNNIKSSLGSYGNSLDINVSAYINFNGKSEKVSEQKMRYSEILKKWTND